MRIVLNIERVVLDGLPLGWHERSSFLGTLETRLSELLVGDTLSFGASRVMPSLAVQGSHPGSSTDRSVGWAFSVADAVVGALSSERAQR